MTSIRGKIVLVVLVAAATAVGLLAWNAAMYSSCAHSDDLRPVPNLEGLESERADRTPRWSGNGETIVVNLGGSLRGVSAAGDGVFEISGVADRNIYSPSLSTNGLLVYQVGFQDKPEYPRYERYIGISDIEAPGDKPAIVKVDDQCNPIYPALSDDGAQYAFILKPDCRDTPTDRMLALGATGDRTIEYYPISDGIEGKVVWSNDGRTVAFAGGTGLSVFSESEGERSLVKTRVRISLPAWSLDGSSLYYVKRNLGDSANSMLYSISPDGSGQRLIADIGNIKVREVQLSPDGSRLLLDAAYIIDVGGGNLVELEKDFWQDNDKTKGESYCYPCATRHASWSPDNRRIAVYVEQSAAHPTLSILAADGSHVQTLPLQ